MEEIKFRFVDDMGDVYEPKTLTELIEQAAYCATYPKAPLLTIKNGDYLELSEALKLFRKGYGDFEQFTGEYDKNRKEIYQGDIVKVNSNRPIRTVCYVPAETGFGLFEKHKNGYSCVPFNRCKHPIEVIGNIHENPELLEEEKMRET